MDSVLIREKHSLGHSEQRPDHLSILQNVWKRHSWFGDWTLCDVCLSLIRGSTVQVTGRNGAGKSTLLRLIAGVNIPTRGKLIRRAETVGFVPERLATELRFSGRSYLRYLANIRGLNRNDTEHRIGMLAELFGIEQLLDKSLRVLSKGSAQKIALCQAFLRLPDLLVLDEPWSGLDISAQRSLFDLINESKSVGGCIIFTDHRESSVQIKIDHELLVADGRVTLNHSKGDACKARCVAIDVGNNRSDSVENLARLPEVLSIERRDAYLRILTSRSNSDDVLRVCVQHGLTVQFLGDVSMPTSSEIE